MGTMTRTEEAEDEREGSIPFKLRMEVVSLWGNAQKIMDREDAEDAGG